MFETTNQCLFSVSIRKWPQIGHIPPCLDTNPFHSQIHIQLHPATSPSKKNKNLLGLPHESSGKSHEISMFYPFSSIFYDRSQSKLRPRSLRAMIRTLKTLTLYQGGGALRTQAAGIQILRHGCQGGVMAGLMA
jgi:hypothetical protein